MKKTLVICMTLTVSHLACQTALAKLTHNSTKPVVFPQDEETSKPITEKDVEKVIPLDMKPGDSMNSVVGRVADRGINLWFNSPAVQGSMLGQTANTVQKKMATDVTVKPADPTGVEHKFSFQLMALQTAARIQYSGLLNAMFNYDARAAQSVVEFSDKVFNKELFVNHTSSNKEDVSYVGIKWGW